MKDNSKKWSINIMSGVLNVSVQRYYKSCKNWKKPYKHKALLAMILEIRAEHYDNLNYGTQRIFSRSLQAPYNYRGTYRSIYKVMKENNLLIKQKRNSNGITKADRDAQKSENLIKQDFSAQNPNEKWLTSLPSYISFCCTTFRDHLLNFYYTENKH
jgi:putative transposase